MLSKFSIILFSAYTMFSCIQRSPRAEYSLTKEERLEQAIYHFDKREYTDAVEILLELRREYPSDKKITIYLAQSLAGRAGMNMFDLSAHTLKVMTEKHVKDNIANLKDMTSALPKPSPEIRQDLNFALNVLEDLKQDLTTTPDQETTAFIFVYKLIYASYLFREILDEVKLTTQTQKEIASLIGRKAPTFVDLSYQLYSAFNLTTLLPLRLKELIAKFLKGKSILVDFDGHKYKIDIGDPELKDLKNLLNTLIQNSRDRAEKLIPPGLKDLILKHIDENLEKRVLDVAKDEATKNLLALVSREAKNNIGLLSPHLGDLYVQKAVAYMNSNNPNLDPSVVDQPTQSLARDLYINNIIASKKLLSFPELKEQIAALDVGYDDNNN